MHYTVALAAIPAVTFGLGYVLTPASPPIAAKAVVTEGIRAVRMDDATFRRRWSQVADMPPATVIKNEATILIADAEPNKPVTLVTKSVHTRRASLRTRDICSRHHMRKVTIGRSWRCRR
jgi:hypothetical protein